MDTSHCYRGYIMLLILFYSFMFDLASNVDISGDERGNKTDEKWKRFLSNSSQHGKEYIMCASAAVEIRIMSIKCNKSPKDIITRIDFADYGNPIGECEDFRRGNCGAQDTLRLVKKNCLGKHKCELLISDEMFGPSECNKDIQLAVLYTCRKA